MSVQWDPDLLKDPFTADPFSPERHISTLVQDGGWRAVVMIERVVVSLFRVFAIVRREHHASLWTLRK